MSEGTGVKVLDVPGLRVTSLGLCCWDGLGLRQDGSVVDMT